MTCATHERPRARALQIVVDNALAHFRLRITSWYMALANLSVGIMLTANPDALSTNPGAAVYFNLLLRIAPEEVWRSLFLIIGYARLISLVVNGTFRHVRWTPYVRAAMSGLSFMIWGAIALSVIWPGYAALGIVVYPSVALFELYNTAVAMSETKRRPEGYFG